jgi:hypothetical protein
MSTPGMCPNCAATLDAAAKTIRERDRAREQLESIRRIVADWASSPVLHGEHMSLITIREILEGV